MTVDVIPLDNGLLVCDCCGTGLFCDDCGDMPEKCPGCGNELDYKDIETKSLSEPEFLEWCGTIYEHHCIDCAYVGDGRELNDLGYCYQKCRMVKPDWACNEYLSPEKVLESLKGGD